jgi:hypothetical protein
MLLSELRKIDGFLWVFRFPMPLSICPSIISIKEGRKGDSLLLSPTLSCFLQQEKINLPMNKK